MTLNNPNVGGDWDFDALRGLIPDIDYKNAGLTEADLNMIGLDFMLQTEGENTLSDELSNLMIPLQEESDRQRKIRREERQAQQISDSQDDDSEERQAKIDHMKNVKQQVKQQAIETVQNMDAYITLSFDNFENKVEFCTRFGFGPYEKFIKGEVFDEMIERID